jgi:hypothetical protein
MTQRRHLSEAAKRRCRSLGHATSRMGDRLYNGDEAVWRAVLEAVEATGGDIPATAARLDVGVRSVYRWVAAHSTLRAAVGVARAKRAATQKLQTYDIGARA